MASHSEDSRRIGHNLRKVRRQKGLMQIEVAVAADMDRSYISRIETGKARITFELLFRLVKSLEILSKDLLEDHTSIILKDRSYNRGGKDHGTKVSQMG